MVSKRTYKNAISTDQLMLMAKHVRELMAAGVSENVAIRIFELGVDIYAKVRNGGNPGPHHVNQVARWSIAAKQAVAANPNLKPKNCLRVEHGTPKRELARMILKDLEGQSALQADAINSIVDERWRLAVITVEEDDRLNKIARSKSELLPDARWAAAGIDFSDDPPSRFGEVETKTQERYTVVHVSADEL